MKLSEIEVSYIDHMGSDLNVVNAARVSFNKKSEQLEAKDERLINYLAEHGHWSPLAHTAIQIHIKAPLFLAAQFKKHQIGLTWNEVSRRYVDEEPEFWFPRIWHKRADSVKQGSSDDGVEDQRAANNLADYSVGVALNTYKNLLEEGVAPEEARIVLPNNTMTQWIWTGSAVAFARVIKQRVDKGAQKAANELGEKISQVVRPIYPISFEALLKQ